MKLYEFAAKVAFPFVFYPKALKNAYLLSFKNFRQFYFNQSREHRAYYDRHEDRRDVRLLMGYSPILVNFFFFRHLVVFKTSDDMFRMTERWTKWAKEQRDKRDKPE